MRSRARTTGSSLASTAGTMSLKMRAPSEPPQTSSSMVAAGGAYRLAACAAMSGRTGMPVSTARPPRGSRAVPGKLVAMASAIRASWALAWPSTALPSCSRIAGRRRPSRRAPSSGGDRGIAAEADHRRGVEPGQDAAGGDGAACDRGEAAQLGGQAAPGDAGAGQHVLRTACEHAAVAPPAPAVGHQHQRMAAPGEPRRERLGGKEMPAGAAGRDHDRTAAHDAASRRLSAAGKPCTRARLRVSASTMPMVSATDIADEPP